MLLKDALIGFHDEFVRRVKADPAMGVARASGKFERTIEKEYEVVTDASGLTGRLVQYGPAYSPFIDAGRPPGKVLRQGIYEWLRYKKYGLKWATDKERISLSWAISKNIQRRGSWKFRTNSQTRIVPDAIAGAQTELARALAGIYTFDVSAKVQEEIDAINKLER